MFALALLATCWLPEDSHASRACKNLSGNFGLVPSCVQSLGPLCADFATCQKKSEQNGSCPTIPKPGLTEAWWSYRECKPCEKQAGALDSEIDRCSRAVKSAQAKAAAIKEMTTCEGVPSLPKECAPNGDVPAKLVAFSDSGQCDSTKKTCPCTYKACTSENAGYKPVNGCWSRRDHKNGAGQAGFEYCTVRKCAKSSDEMPLRCWTN
jgi:hypothetical protein